MICWIPEQIRPFNDRNDVIDAFRDSPAVAERMSSHKISGVSTPLLRVVAAISRTTLALALPAMRVAVPRRHFFRAA